MKMALVLLLVMRSETTFGQELILDPAEIKLGEFQMIGFDDTFLFVSRNFGKMDGPQSRQQMGLFVYSKSHQKWMRISQVSTNDGVFGKSNSPDPAKRENLRRLSVAWDWTSLAEQKQVELPLRTSGSIVFPDRIQLDAERKRYELLFFSRLGVKNAETHLYFQQSELLAAFGRTAPL